MRVNAGDIKKGSYISYKNEPHVVVSTSFMYKGRGSAHMRAKLKNLLTSSNIDATFKTSDSVEELDVSSNELQFLYADGTEAVFMNDRTYEQTALPLALVDDAIRFLVPEVKVHVLSIDEKPIGLRLPPKVTLEVTEAFDASAGNTVTAAKKNVTLETGIEVQVPIFIKKGEKVLVDTSTGQYVSRA